MKIVAIPSEFTRLDGSQFQTILRDSRGNAVFKKEKEGYLRDPSGNLVAETKDMNFGEAVKAFCEMVFKINEHDVASKKDGAKDFSIEDATMAADIIRACNVVANGVLELENAPHKWLVEKVKQYGVRVYAIDSVLILEAVEGATDKEQTRSERRRETK